MKRSFAVTLVYIMVLITITSNIVRIWTVLAWSDVLTEFSARLSPSASAIIGALWIAVSYVLYWSISQKKAWAWKMLLGTAAGYTVGYWCERLFFQNPRPNTVFAVIVNLVLMIVIYFAIKSLSREAYERKIENPVIK